MKFLDDLEAAEVPILVEHAWAVQEITSRPTYNKHMPTDRAKWMPFMKEYVRAIYQDKTE